MTQVLFSPDGQRATIALLGVGNDPDPFQFYEALKVPQEDYQGKWSKKLAIPGSQGQKAFLVACVFSKQLQGNGSCTLSLHAEPGLVEVVRSEGRARLTLSGADAAAFAQNFVVQANGEIFRSREGRLHASYSPAGTFVLEWR